MDKQIEQSNLKSNEHLKITITQSSAGEISVTADGVNQTDFFQVLGMIEVAKNNLMQSIQNQEVVEVELDELDIKLNPEADVKVGQKIPMPKAAFDMREKQRALAMESKADMKIEK